MLPIITGSLAFLAILGALVCTVLVLIQLFKAKGAAHGILGILCGFYPYIWGWMNATTLNLKKVMIWWTLLMVVFGLFYAVTIGAVIKAAADQGAFNVPPPASESELPSNP